MTKAHGSRPKRGPSAERIAQAREVALARLRGEAASMPPMAKRNGPAPRGMYGKSERAVASRTKAGHQL